MLPNFRDGQVVRVRGVSPSRLKRGDVIGFRFPPDPSRKFIKRVVGLPGDVIEIQRGTVFINGEKLDEPYLIHGDGKSMDAFRVPSDSYFVLGDNRRASFDSRDWGPVPADYINGKVK